MMSKKSIIIITVLVIVVIVFFVPITATGKTIASSVMISLSNLFMGRKTKETVAKEEAVSKGTKTVVNAWKLGLYLTPVGLPIATYRLITDRENFMNELFPKE